MPASTRRLPAQPNLDQLRKQAKDLLDHYRAGDPAATREVRQFEWRADPAAFALHDAQRVLARAYGFDSWPKLKAFVDGANVKRLREAVESGDLAQVRVLLSARPELIGMDMSGGDERQALHFAVLRSDAAMVKQLMEAGADARKGVYPHRSATSALTLARERGDTAIVALIEEEERLRREEMSCPNATVSPVQDQITEAVRHGHTAEALQLLDADKTLIHACDRQGGTPLHIAAQVGNEELVTWLLDRRANPGKEDLAGLTPLDRAALVAHPAFPAVARLLIARGASVTLNAAVALGDLARLHELLAPNPAKVREIGPHGGLLTVAVRHNQLETARLLLDLGADVDERVFLTEVEEPTLSWGHPLWHAALAGQYDMCELLLDRGADPNANVYASGWPIRNAWRHDDPSVRQLLLARGATLPPFMIAELHDVAAARDILARDSSEQVATDLLDAAADGGCPEIVAMCLPRLDWPRRDNKWRWYLVQPIRGIGNDQPTHEGHFACMELLLRHGIHPDVAAFGQTALHFTAAWHGGVNEAERARFAAMLIDYGASLTARDELLHSTPLAWACRWGRHQLAEVLIARGAPIDEPDAPPWATPMAWAEKMGHHHLLALLRGE
jgi:ankyrin repeat protein